MFKKHMQIKNIQRNLCIFQNEFSKGRKHSLLYDNSVKTLSTTFPLQIPFQGGLYPDF